MSPPGAGCWGSTAVGPVYRGVVRSAIVAGLLALVVCLATVSTVGAAPAIGPAGTPPTTEPPVEIGVPTSVVRDPLDDAPPVEVQGRRVEKPAQDGVDWQWLLLLLLIPLGVAITIRAVLTRRERAGQPA